MKVAFVNGVNSNLDASRGIGAHTNTLLNEFTKLGKENIEIVDDPNNADICHITKFNPFFVSIPFIKPAKKVVLTIHDLIPLIYPRHYPSGLKGSINFVINKLLIWKNVDSIITISETSKKDICRFLGINPKKIYVIYLAPRSIFKPLTNTTLLYSNVVKRYNLPSKFALYVGDINYNKNIPNLVNACQIARIPLVIAGKQAIEISELMESVPHGPKDILRSIFGVPHPQLSHLREVINLFNKNNIFRLGFVPDGDLVKIYNLATVYIQPSFYEGFGLPLLEAIACKTPVVVTRNQCHIEILGDNFNYVNPNDPESIAKGISNPNTDKKLPRDYSWEKTATQTLEVYKQSL